MRTFNSKILGETIVIAEGKEDFEEAKEKADKLDCVLYTQREVDYLLADVRKMASEERKQYLEIINEIKKKFLGFISVPKNWRFPHE